jgi:3-methyladenine DNA glycosylase AlkD
MPSTLTAANIRQRLALLADAATAAGSRRFFKTGKGEYGEGDRFRGIRVPVLRRLAREYQAVGLPQVLRLLQSRFHEDRLLALLLLVQLFARGDEALRRRIYQRYLASTRYVNNWDLVDSSAEHIAGAWLWTRSRQPLRRLARSKNLWERRIAIIATFHFIRRGQFRDTLEIAAMLRDDREDLIHKAVGWMLREVGNRHHATEVAFLKSHCRRMPRTMLRYAIEKFPARERAQFTRRD